LDLERAVVLSAQRGGQWERQQLIDAFMPSIMGIARMYRQSAAVEWNELLQEGAVGLLRALERYDAEIGVPFWAYAGWWVRQAMQKLVSELSGPLVLSDRALRQLARIKEAQRRFEQTERKEPTCGELAEIVGLPRTQVESLICTERTARGLDEPTGGESGDGSTLGEQLADPLAEEPYEQVPDHVLASDLPRLLDHLTEREQIVIRSRYGIGVEAQTLRAVASTLGVSAERVRQIEQDSLTKMHCATCRGDGAEVARTRRRGSEETPCVAATAA
jgi:RNA polymerase sigma factor (sigma-70 family)